jgi:hypothetical protein
MKENVHMNTRHILADLLSGSPIHGWAVSALCKLVFFGVVSVVIS